MEYNLGGKELPDSIKSLTVARIAKRANKTESPFNPKLIRPLKIFQDDSILLKGSVAANSLARVLEQSKLLNEMVEECAEDVAIHYRVLEEEIREKHVLEHQLNILKKQEEAARHASFHDPLTSLPNRVVFYDRLGHGLAQAKRHGWTLAVMFIAIDDFNSIKDTYGHEVTDTVVRIVVNRLIKMTRDDDTVSRHGGDEFFYLLLELKNEEVATAIAKKIIRTISEPCDVSANNLVLSLSLSIRPGIGIAMFPKDGETADALVKSADNAMYRAKGNKSGYSFAR